MASATWVGTPSIRGKSSAARMALLTVCLAGVQFTWGIEMAYCTPYLLSLGVSKSKTSLVWIAGPLSGLITQPIVGALADRSRLKWGRRRPFMIAGTAMVAFSLLMLGWTSEVVGLFAGGNEEKQKSATIVVAVLSIYVLDFAVNAVQASCRAIIVDTLSIRRQQQGSAWASRMIAAGNVISYLAGSIDLVGIFGHWFLGNTQFKKLCLISSVILGGTVGLTSWAVSERVLLSRRESESKEGVFHIFVVIYQTLFNLPNRIRAICFIQFFAWLGWFPFLFFSSTWVGEVYQRYDQPKLPKSDDGDGGRPKDAVADIARVGSMALVLFAIISLIGSITLPWVVQSPPSDTEHRRRPPQIALVTRILELIKPFKPTLSTAWMVSHVIFAIAMSLAVFATSLKFATVLVVICGIPWAITCWAPFAMLGEEINRISQGSSGDHLMNDSGEVYNRLQQLVDHEGDDDDEERQRLTKEDDSASSSGSDDDEMPEETDLGGSRTRTPRDSGSRTDLEAANLAPPPRSPREVSRSSDGSMSPTLHIVQTPELQTEEAQNASTGELAGIYLGILNLFITLPQFVGSFMSFIVFAILEPGKSPELAEGGADEPPAPQKGVNAIAVTMLIGGLGSIVAAWRTFKLPRVR
ncbi:hypothetical protein TWF696_002058 [Orbilia brochopaga]|uniref:Sucrose transporter n=1 Tax=Orbilia brochopaga TaxID=3140254 RepID=A0AAV9UAM3_9PEZI